MKKISTLTAVLLFSYLICCSQVGTLDQSFGDRGKVNTNIQDLNKGREEVHAVVVQPDGKIVFAGTTKTPGIICRYNADGTPDNTFDGDGRVFCYGYSFNCIALQPDGKIIAAGSGFTLVRLNANGTFDNSFDGDGKASATIGSYYGIANAIALQSDGKIVVAGASYNGSGNDFALARFNTDGSLDNNFDGDGKLVSPFSTFNNEIRGLAVQSDGKIMVAGSNYNGTNATLFALARYNTDGTPDNNFDGDGKLTTSFGSSNDYATSIVLQNDGKIVVAGFNDHDLALARYNSNGSPDNNFDADGKVTAVCGSSNNSSPSVALRSDGKIVVAITNASNFGLFRYNTDGSPDNSFDGDGSVTTAMGLYGDQVKCIAMVPATGKIVVGGYSLMPIGWDFALACYMENGC